MKTCSNPAIDINLNEFPDNLVNLITGLLDDKDYSIKHNARSTLVKMGKTVIPQMHKLLASKKEAIRIEAARIVELIVDRKSISLLIGLLDDTEFDIRWIAAEGLIRIGRRTILPLLKSIRDRESSYFVNKGARHVLINLQHEKEKEKLRPLLQSLDNYRELGEIAPVEASRALINVFKCHS